MSVSKSGLLFCGAEDSKIRVYDLNYYDPSKGGSNNYFNGQHDDVITCICMTRDEEMLFTGSSRNDQVIRAWSVKT